MEDVISFLCADEVHQSQLRELKHTIEQRSRFDGGHMSEPLALHSLCLEWLQKGGGLGRAPQQLDELRGLIHERRAKSSVKSI